MALLFHHKQRPFQKKTVSLLPTGERTPNEQSFMRKVLLINGSPRENGNTFLALQEAARTLEEQGIDSEVVWIGNKPVRGCIACATCKTKGNGMCVFDDDVCNKVIGKMNESDALIVGSPVYYGVPTGQVIALVQRMLFAGADVKCKPAAAKQAKQ